MISYNNINWNLPLQVVDNFLVENDVIFSPQEIYTLSTTICIIRGKQMS